MQIIQKTTRITAQEEVQGANVSYSYLQGTVTKHDFNMQNNNFQPSDIDLIKHIHETCTSILKGENTEKPKSNDTEE